MAKMDWGRKTARKRFAGGGKVNLNDPKSPWNNMNVLGGGHEQESPSDYLGPNTKPTTKHPYIESDNALEESRSNQWYRKPPRGKGPGTSNED